MHVLQFHSKLRDTLCYFLDGGKVKHGYLDQNTGKERKGAPFRGPVRLGLGAVIFLYFFLYSDLFIF